MDDILDDILKELEKPKRENNLKGYQYIKNKAHKASMSLIFIYEYIYTINNQNTGK